MDITVPNIVKPLDLGGHQPEFAGQVFQVWINLPVERLQEYFGWQRELMLLLEKLKVLTEADKVEAEKISAQMTELVHKMDGFYALVWSQGTDPSTHFTAEEVDTLREKTASQAPHLFNWIVANTLDMLLAYRKKK